MKIMHRQLLLFVFVHLLSRPCSAPAQDAPPVSAAAVLQPFVERSCLAGAVAAVASKEKVLSSTAVGFTHVGEKTVMGDDSLFWIASQSKPMTAAAVMMLVDEGKLSLDDPVEKHLPEFRGQMVAAEKDDAHVLLRKPSRPVQVRDLLSHMSGLPFKSALEEPTLDGLPLATAVRSYAMTPLQWDPGKTLPQRGLRQGTHPAPDAGNGQRKLWPRFLDRGRSFWPRRCPGDEYGNFSGKGPHSRLDGPARRVSGRWRQGPRSFQAMGDG
jgi:CubicO group peptidase (beta-lactamase class C family)